jgi:methylenetetrahydrofolate reductase (NADPH)
MNLNFNVPPTRRLPMQVVQPAPASGKTPRLAISCEFFPPKPSQEMSELWKAVEALRPLDPDFCSVTYGAGGSTQRATGAIAAEIQARIGVKAAAHLTCVDATRAEVELVAESYWDAGIRHIVALRGDPREGVGAPYRPATDGYPYADSLVAALSRLHPFEISVAAYPETHPQARSADDDLDHLKRKIDSGATRIITQFCFDMVAFERFLDRCARAGIRTPIVPGILPIVNFAKLETFAAACGASIPDDLRAACLGIDDDPHRRHRLAVDHAVAQCSALQSLGAQAFHFYTLNRAELVRDICDGLGLVPNEYGRSAPDLR